LFFFLLNTSIFIHLNFIKIIGFSCFFRKLLGHFLLFSHERSFRKNTVLLWNLWFSIGITLFFSKNRVKLRSRFQTLSLTSSFTTIDLLIILIKSIHILLAKDTLSIICSLIWPNLASKFTFNASWSAHFYTIFSGINGFSLTTVAIVALNITGQLLVLFITCVDVGMRSISFKNYFSGWFSFIIFFLHAHVINWWDLAFSEHICVLSKRSGLFVYSSNCALWLFQTINRQNLLKITVI